MNELLQAEPEEQPGPDMEQIKKSVLGDIDRARSFFESKIEPVLRTRHQLYEADRKLYEERFRELSKQSDFVSYDFWSLVQWAIPRVMNSFFNGGDAIAIVGREGEDTDRADVLKGLIDYQIMTQNKGFLLLWDWFTDAFKYNLGAVKVYWRREKEWGEVQAEEMPQDRLLFIMDDPSVQVTDFQGPDPFGMCRVSYRVQRLKENRPVIESIRVTDLRWSAEARTLEEANFVAHRKLVSADHLRRQAQAGIYDPAAVEKVVEEGNTESVRYLAFELELNDELNNLRHDDEDKARTLIELHECYTKLDINGDGLLEDALVSVAGDQILRIEENPWGRVPIFAISPIRDAHKVMASLSFSEIVGEVQSLKVAMIRQLVINTANVNNLRHFVDHTSVNVDDLLTNRQYIRTTGNPQLAAMPFPQAGVAPWTMNFMEYLEGSLEAWTGKTRYNQGMDSRSLNKTATGITLLTQASEQRIDYIVRVFAETGVGEMMRFLVELNQRYIDQPQVVRLKNKPLVVSPDDLKGEFDIDVNTEAGVGKKKQVIQNLQFYLGMLAPTAMQIGAATPAEWAKAAQKLLVESGVRNPEEYVRDPEQIKQEFLQQMMATMTGGGADESRMGGAASQGGGAGPGGGNSAAGAGGVPRSGAGPGVPGAGDGALGLG